MGISADAILAYGYQINEEEIPEEYETEDFPEQVEQRLLFNAGFVETDWRTDDTYFERRRKDLKDIDIEVVIHCSFDYPQFLLVVSSSLRKSYEGVVIHMTPNFFVPETTWDDKLWQALKVLGLQRAVHVAKPTWVLVSRLG